MAIIIIIINIIVYSWLPVFEKKKKTFTGKQINLIAEGVTDTLWESQPENTKEKNNTFLQRWTNKNNNFCNNNNSKNWKDTRHSYCTNGTEAAPLVHMVPLRTQESAQSFTHSAGSIFGSKLFFFWQVGTTHQTNKYTYIEYIHRKRRLYTQAAGPQPSTFVSRANFYWIHLRYGGGVLSSDIHICITVVFLAWQEII